LSPKASGATAFEHALQRWADGKGTLKDVRGYTDEELYTIAKVAYFLYHQGRLKDARVLLQGLYAVNPADPYVARALGLVELAGGHPEVATQFYDLAIKLAPNDAAAYVARAELRVVAGQKPSAIADLRMALELSEHEDPLNTKAYALLKSLTRR
jgi:tetratricopeptide (TPR) repeat protein